jgi:integrase
MATIQERRGKDGQISYRVQIRLKGHPSMRRTFPRKTDAKRWAQETEADLRRGRAVPTALARKKTLSDGIARYISEVLPTKPKSQKKQTAQLGWWRDHYGHLALSSVTPNVLSAARERLLSEPTPRGPRRSPATVMRYIAVLSHLFTTAVTEWGWLEANPMSRVRKPKQSQGRVRWLDPDERERLFAACRASRSSALYPVVVLAVSTGMRRGEILALEWPDINLKTGQIVVHETKNDERRSIVATGEALELLRARAKVRRLDTRLVFPGGTRPDGTIPPADIRTAWDHAAARAELHDFTFHDLRHTAASYLAMSGATLAEIAAVLGHKSEPDPGKPNHSKSLSTTSHPPIRPQQTGP